MPWVGWECSRQISEEGTAMASWILAEAPTSHILAVAASMSVNSVHVMRRHAIEHPGREFLLFT
jgi:hypothetical protein